MEINADLSAENNALLNELCQKLLNTTEIRITNSGALYVDSIKWDHKNVEKQLAELFSYSGNSKFRPLLFCFTPSSRILDVIKRCIRVLQHTMKSESLKGSGDIRSLDLTRYRPIVSMDEGGAVSFINTATMKVVKMSVENYEKYVPKEYRQEAIFGKVVFNPYVPLEVYLDTIDGQKVTCANLYQKPEWQLDRELKPEEIASYSHCPKVIKRFMETLFPDIESREFVFDWLHHAFTSRSETYLVLNGAKGIGKGIFTDHLCKALMGKDNHKLAAPGALESNFNSMLENCRMIVFDEMPINDSDKIAKLKKYINTDQAVEKKGKDVGATITTYNSFIISSNHVTDMRIEWDDRRFSVMDMTDKKLTEQWTKDEIEELIQAIDDSSCEVIRAFGYWLMYRIPKDNRFGIYKGKHFYKLCYASLPEWQRLIIDEVTSGIYEVIDDVTLKMKFKDRSPMGKFPANTSKVEDFIKSYMHEGKYSLGSIVRTENGGFDIVVSDHYYQGRDSTGIEFVSAESLL